ncbi:uncharacterized protein LOC112600433, partial [Melanaphis sacchari]|uniref:uncharacterized protein LOC112600433 n=1 Tax=Melanaphis sacchari TaxID=742174 RepID=UPI000DC14DFB
MKMTVFRVFTSCIATVCFISSVSSRAAPVLPLVSVMNDVSPITEKHLDKQHENFVKQNFVDLKPCDSEIIANNMLRKLAVNKPVASTKFSRLRGSYDTKVKDRLNKDIDDDNNTFSLFENWEDAIPILMSTSEQENEHYELPEPYNSFEQDSTYQSNESNHPQESNESNYPQESNESNYPQESNESNHLQESNESNHLQ